MNLIPHQCQKLVILQGVASYPGKWPVAGFFLTYQLSITEIMGALGPFEWMIIILLLLLLFGARKIPGLARGIGQGIFEFRKAMKDDKREGPDEDGDQNGKNRPD